MKMPKSTRRTYGASLKAICQRIGLPFDKTKPKPQAQPRREKPPMPTATTKTTPCPHKRVAHIPEQAYWVCADCWAKLQERPTRYGPPPRQTGGLGRTNPPQVAIWKAEIAKASGMLLTDFLRVMVWRFLFVTKNTITQAEAFNIAIEVMKAQLDPYGHPDCDWSRAAAIDLANEEMSEWDTDGGRGGNA